MRDDLVSESGEERFWVSCGTILLNFAAQKEEVNDASTLNVGPSGHVNKCALSALTNEEKGVKERCEGCQLKALQKISTARILKKRQKKKKG